MEDFIRLLAKQQSLSGGTSLISMYIPPNGRVSLSKQKLTSELGLVSNIKSKVVQKHTKTALKSTLKKKSLRLLAFAFTIVFVWTGSKATTFLSFPGMRSFLVCLFVSS